MPRQGIFRWWGLAVVAGIGAVCTLAIWLAPDLVVSVIAGPEYAGMARLLPLFGPDRGLRRLRAVRGVRAGRHQGPQLDSDHLGGLRY
ncbi:MAG: hypothetical protein R2687_01010 [Candidatus Nanopelagicales bacterium]